MRKGVRLDPVRVRRHVRPGVRPSNGGTTAIVSLVVLCGTELTIAFPFRFTGGLSGRRAAFRGGQNQLVLPGVPGLQFRLHGRHSVSRQD